MAKRNIKEEIARIDSEMTETSKNLSSMTQEKLSEAPIVEKEPQTMLSKKEIEGYDAPVIQPTNSFPPLGKKKPEQAGLRRHNWEYIKVIAENLEVKGEMIEFWFKPPISGEPNYYWQVPTNVPVYLPRMIAEHLASRFYHRMKMEDIPVSQVAWGQPMQRPVAASKHRRLDCRPAGFAL